MASGRSPSGWSSNGHRAPDEFDLASPRWQERPEAVAALAARLADGLSPLALHEKRVAESAARLEQLSRQLPPARRRELDQQLTLVRRYLRFREDGKHFLMLGYQLLRDLALEAGRRLGLGEDVFCLSSSELQESLTTGFAPLHLIHERRLVRAAEAKLVLGHVITEADLDALGQAAPCGEAQRLAAFPISAGLSTGPARIVRSLSAAGELGRGYVLVCPSTDPSWTPLFINAAGLILECGGTLSHGAVVARELGIPAVVCAGATQLFQDGEMIQVDGHHGAISRIEASNHQGHVENCSLAPVLRGEGWGEGGSGKGPSPCESRTGWLEAECSEAPAGTARKSVDGNSTRIPRHLIPPAVGRCERRGAHLRNLMLLVWGVYLAAAFLLPQDWLYQPSLELLDRLLWPVVAAWGKPAAVAVAALALALLSMLGQWLLTDTRRLRVAKERAAQLRKWALPLPAGTRRRQELLRLARPVQTRLLLAAMLPLALLLGPMVMSFLWFPQRVDPASWNAQPGATAYVVATVDGECPQPIRLAHDAALTLDEATPAAQSLPPIRATLEGRLARWQQSSDLSNLPWELQEAGRRISQNLVADLSAYLRHDLPPQTLSWTLYTPRDRPGRFPVTLSVGDASSTRTGAELAKASGGRQPPDDQRVSSIQTHVVLGDLYPPERKADLGDGKPSVQVVRPADRASPIKLVKVTYFEAKRPGRSTFWAPLARLGWSGWDAGWLLTYLLAYLPAMFLLRWLLRIP